MSLRKEAIAHISTVLNMATCGHSEPVKDLGLALLLEKSLTDDTEIYRYLKPLTGFETLPGKIHMIKKLFASYAGIKEVNNGEFLNKS